MKKSIQILFVLLTMISLSGCKVQTEKVENKVPFEITKKTYRHYSQASEGKKGALLEISGTTNNPGVHFETVFFNETSYDANAVFQNINLFNIRINMISPVMTKDLKMTLDPKNEYGNTAAPKTSDSPFKLKKNEAVLLYNVNGKQFYYKITGIETLGEIEL